MQRVHAFSLVEVTLAIGVIAFALLAIFSLIPVGLSSGRAAIEATHTSLIAQDMQNRVQSALTSTTFAGAGSLTITNYYDRNAVALAGYPGALYRAVATVAGDWGANAAPPNVDAGYLRPVTVQIGWPVDPATGSVAGNNAARATFGYYVRKP